MMMVVGAIVWAMVSCQESLADKSEREAVEYTRKKCPARIDKNTTIDSLVFDKRTLTMHYYYTMSGNGDNPELLRQVDARQVLLDKVRNSTSLKKYKDAGFNFAYIYFSEKHRGDTLFSTVITRADYSGK